MIKIEEKQFFVLKRMIAMVIFALLTVCFVFGKKCNAASIYTDSQGIIYNLDEGSVQGYSGNILSEVTIPMSINVNGNDYSISIIERDAFYECKKIEKVIISDGISWVQENAFAACSNLQMLEFPMLIEIDEQNNSVMTVCGYNMTNAQNYAQTNNLTFVSKGNPKGKVIGSNSLTWELDETGLLTISGTGGMGDEFNSNSYPRDYVEEVIVNNGITNLSKGAFDYCQCLRKVTLPDSITSIGQDCFNGCCQLVICNMPRNLKYIGRDAFSGCQLWKCNEIPTSVTYIGESAFSQVGEINCASANPNYCVAEGVLYTKDMRRLLAISYNKEGTYKMPDTVLKIDSLGGHTVNYSVSELILSSGMDYIDYYMFSGGSNLKKVIVPSSIKEIRDGAFRDCRNLKTVVIQSTEVEIEEEAFGYYFYSNSGGYGVEKVKDLTIYGVKGSGAEAYAVENGFTFKDISEYVETDNGNNSTDVPSNGSSETNKNGEKQENTSGADSKKEQTTKKVSLKKGSKVVVSGVQYQIVDLKKKTVSYVKPTKKIKSTVIIGATVKIQGKKYKITKIADNAFKGNKKIKKVTIGKNITTIGKNAFNGCKKLKTIEVKSKKIKKIGKNAFKGIVKNPTLKTDKKYKSKYMKMFQGK